MVGLRPRNKAAAVFESFGWGGGAAKSIEESLRKAGMEVLSPALTVQWVPSQEEKRRCYEFGREFAKKI